MLKRIYEDVIDEHFKENRQMLFLVGPRQVGKTTTSLEIAEPRPNHYYLNWDIQKDRETIVQGPDHVAISLGLNRALEELPMIVFDELHKYSRWKTFLKGFFDKYAKVVQIIVTGSARLDVYKMGGDSLMGRYFLYRLHPLSVGEIVNPSFRASEWVQPKKISDEKWSALVAYGGFPEPFLRHSSPFHTRWKRLRTQLLFEEDLRDQTRIHELKQMQILAEILSNQVGGLINYSSLAKMVNVSVDTVKRWIETLKSFYYCFSLQPWTQNISRSLIKEPKIFMWDWSTVKDEGARFENLVASHLLKAVHYWSDRGLGDYELYFLRDKEKREVDFLVVKNGKPWFLVEAKCNDKNGISKSLYHYQKQTEASHAFQVSAKMAYVQKDCFSYTEPIIVPARTLLSQLI